MHFIHTTNSAIAIRSDPIRIDAMPPKFRQRGKKKKQPSSSSAASSVFHPAPSHHQEQKPEHEHEQEQDQDQDQDQDQPSWIVDGPPGAAMNVASGSEAPFGYVDAEVKAYLRQTNEQLVALSPSTDEFELLLSATLSEIDGSELTLATDMDTSLILEALIARIAHKPLRILLDRFAGNYAQLAAHRYGSHVLQAALVALQQVITAENAPEPECPRPADEHSQHGLLRSGTRLLLDMVAEIRPAARDMLRDQFASHVLRTAILLLAGEPAAAQPTRSRRSAKFRSKRAAEAQHSIPSASASASASASPTIAIPRSFEQHLAELAAVLVDRADALEPLLSDPVSAPVLHLIIPHAPAPALADRILALPPTIVETALRDSVASHVLEAAAAHASAPAFCSFYDAFLAAKLATLSSHPVAHFVVARAAERLEGAQLAAAVDEVRGRPVRPRVLHALVARLQDPVPFVRDAFGLVPAKDDALVVPAILALQPKSEYVARPAKPVTQGSLLLQQKPLRPLVLASLLALAQDEKQLLALTRDPSAVHVILSVLPDRGLTRALLPHMHTLADDKWGSRVADALWIHADGFTRERIARLAIEHERSLLASHFGTFFLRKLNLPLFRRGRVEEWKRAVADAIPSSPTPLAGAGAGPTRLVVDQDADADADDEPRRKKQKTRTKVDQQLDSILAVL